MVTAVLLLCISVPVVGCGETATCRARTQGSPTKRGRAAQCAQAWWKTDSIWHMAVLLFWWLAVVRSGLVLATDGWTEGAVADVFGVEVGSVVVGIFGCGGDGWPGCVVVVVMMLRRVLKRGYFGG